MSSVSQPFPWNPLHPKPLSLTECQDILSQREAILESITDGFLVLDREWRFVFVNREAARLLRRSKQSLIGRAAWEEFPAAVGTEIERACRKAMDERVTVSLEYQVPNLARWFDVRASPADVGAAIFFRDITKRKRLEAEVRKRERALRDANQRKDEFLAMLAHELRNPLGAVRNAAMVLESSNTEADRKWATAVVLRQVGQLAGLVDDLLDVSRITMGKIRLEKQRIDAVTAIGNAIESASPLISERGHQLIRNDENARPLWVDADPIRLEQIVLNLLTNAAKYTERGGVIAVSAQRGNGEVAIHVKDTGMGIAPDRLQDMFGLFVQGERSLARSEGGLGLGLTIVRQLAEMHGGRVTASSEGIGKGSEFALYLPAAPAPPDGAHTIASADRPGTDGHGLRVLVVEDNVDSATALAKLLRIHGYTVETTYDGPSAIEKAGRFQPEAVLLDIGLPGLDGYAVARQFRQNACCEHALLIAVSGYGQEEDRRRSREAGFDHHLVKPIDHEELQRMLRERAKQG